MDTGDHLPHEAQVGAPPPAGLEAFAVDLREQLVAAAERQVALDDRCARTGRPLRSR